MSYIWLALLSAAIFGFVTVLDKRLVDKYMPSLSAFYVSVGMGLVTYAVITMIITGIPEDPTLDRLAAAGASGLCWGGALGMMFWGYKYEEASRASAIIHTFPVFVALLAVTLLGEVLSAVQWAAIVVVVLGAFLVSLRGFRGGAILRVNRAFPILIAASLFTALAHLTNKYALAELPIPFVYAMRNFGMGLVFAFMWRRGTFGQVLQVFRNRQSFATLLLAEYILAPLAILLNVTATSMGPVSMVSTLTASRPFFVFIYSTLLSIPAIGLLNEPLERRTLAVKIVSVALIIGGIAALTLL